MDVAKDYYEGLRQIIVKRFEGDATWNDVVEYRAHYKPTTYDYVQRGSAILMEFLQSGYKLLPPSDECSLEDQPSNGFGRDIAYNSDGTYTYTRLIQISQLENVTPELIMQKHNLDPTKWECVNYRNNYWSNGQKNDRGENVACFQSKITVKPKDQVFDFEKLKEDMRNYTPALYKPTSLAYSGGENLFVPCFYDVHFGKLAYEPETGENYDVNIAARQFAENSNAYISRIRDKKIDRILYVIGQDFIHSEPDGKTVNKTPQDVDGRYQKIFHYACQALVDSIYNFKQLAPVDVVLVQGNHAETSEFYLAEYLAAYFRNDPDIHVDSSPMLRKYYRYGNTLLGLSHGEYEGQRIAQLMPVEAASDWGQTKYHEFLLGHLHHESSTESTGLTIRRIPSMCGTDAWSKKMGYCISPKRTVAFVYNKDDGLIETMYQPVHN